MPYDPYALLDEAIAASARERDIKRKQDDDEQAAMVRRRDEANAIWSRRKDELPAIVKVIDRKLKDHAFAGLTLGTYELKHSDIGRVVIELEHSPHSTAKILFCVTKTGEFTCSIGSLTGYVTSSQGPITDLSADRLKEVLSQAVTACLSGNPASSVARNDKAALQATIKPVNVVPDADADSANSLGNQPPVPRGPP